MSIACNNITATTIGVANIGTELTTDNSTKIASGNFLINAWNSFNFIINGIINYTITGTKTFPTGMPITAGTNALFPITLGAVKASTIDIKPVNATTQLILIAGQTQQLSANFGTGGTNVFRNPIVVKGINNRMLNGSITAITAGATVVFTNAFNSVPLVFLCIFNSATPANCGVFDVSATGFKAYANGSFGCYWFAIGS